MNGGKFFFFKFNEVILGFQNRDGIGEHCEV